MTLVFTPQQRIPQRHERSSDRRSARATIGLQHVAVEHNGVLAQGREVDNRAQCPANESGNFVGAAPNFPPHGFPTGTRVGRARQHCVLGRDPAQARSFAPPWYALGDGGLTQHLSAAERNQDASLAHVEIVAFNFYVTHLVRTASIQPRLLIISSSAHLLASGFSFLFCHSVNTAPGVANSMGPACVRCASARISCGSFHGGIWVKTVRLT